MYGKNREGLTGSNVTIPYKETVISYLKDIAPEAEKIGAVNTLFFTPEGVKGYNTDYMGFDRMLQAAGISLTGKRCNRSWAMGGCGQGRVLQVVADRKAETVQILSRHPSRRKRACSISWPSGRMHGYGFMPKHSPAARWSSTPLRWVCSPRWE